MLDRTTPPPVRPFGHLTLPSMERIVLPNGIVLNVYSHAHQDVAQLYVLTPGGVVDADGSPMAAMLTSVMLDGSKAYPDSTLSDLFDYNGAKITPSITDHYTGLSLRTLNSRWSDVLPAFTDMLFAPQLSEHAVDISRRRMAHGADVAMQRVEFKAKKAIRQLAYGPTNPKAVMTTPELVLSTTRDDLVAWHQRLYSDSLAGMELFLSGRITPAMVDDVARIFGSLTVDPSRLHKPLIVPFEPTAPAREFVLSPGALQSAIEVAIPTIPRSHPDYIMLRCAVVALGGYFGSRLMANIREDKGYTYGIQAGLLGSPEGTVMHIHTSADNAYVEGVLTEIRAEIERLYTGDFTPDELDRLRKYLMSDLAQNLDTAFTITSCHILERVSFTGPDYFSRQFDTINSITPQSLADVARRHLPLDKLIIAVAGDKC